VYQISTAFADLLRRPDREFNVKVLVDKQEFDNTKVVDFSVENSLSLSDGFELGTAIPSKLILKLRTNEVIPANARMVPYLSLPNTDWLPLGEFYVDGREKTNDVWTFTCYDKLVFADVAYVSQLRYPTTMQAVWDEIMRRLGWSYGSSIVINPAYRMEIAPTGYSCRQVLSYIAGANCASIYIDKAGALKFKRFSAADNPVFSMTTSDYFTAKQTNPVKTFTKVAVTYKTEDELQYTAGSGDDNHTLFYENPFMTQTMTNNLYNALNGFSYLPLSLSARGYPQLEQGDIVGFEQQEGTAWVDTMSAWQNTYISWDGIARYRTIILHQVFNFAGGLRMSIEAPSISEQRSEFNVDRTLATAVNDMTKDVVKYGIPYFGITHSRTEGMVIEREDHRSKLTLNSDKMDWQVDGASTLFYDPWDNTLKFNGHLGAASGTFRGDLIAASGTFSGDLIAANGTFTGTLMGADGDFSGTLTSSFINGGEIYGTRISGADIIGSRIRTSDYGDRIELDVDGFVFYDNNNSRRVTLGTNYDAGISGHTYYNSSSQSQGLIYANPDEFHVIGNQYLRVGTNYGMTYAQGTWKFIGTVDFSDASIIGLR
jgi:hypothetical protein